MTYIPVDYDREQMTRFSPVQYDAFNRLRISSPFTLVDVSHVRDKNDVQESEVLTGSGACNYDPNISANVLSVTTNGDGVKRQCRQRVIYLPAKSLQIFFTTVLNNGPNQSGVVSKVGLFDDDNGIYIQYDTTSNELSIVKRTKTSGVVQETIINRNAWNGVKLDGNEENGITLDLTKVNLFCFWTSWLGAGNFTVSTIIDGKTYILHSFSNSNSTPVVYIQNASLPVRYEISSTGGSGSLQSICYSGISEGGFNPSGRQFSISSGVTPKSVSTATTPVIAIKLKNTHLKVNVRLLDVSIFRDNAKDGIFRIYVFRDIPATSVLTGSNFVSASPDSAIEYDTASTVINTANGTLLATKYYSGSATEGISIDNKASNSFLTSNIQGVSDLLVLTFQVFSTNSNVYASCSFREFF